MARLRHLRHGEYDRVRRRRRLKKFLEERSDTLAETATPVECTAVVSYAEGLLTIEAEENADPDDTITLGDVVYTFVEELTGAYDVLIGADETETGANFAAAVNAGAGEDTVYGSGTEANAFVTANDEEDGTVTITARISGEAYNDIVFEVSGDHLTADPLEGGANHISATDHGLSAGSGPYVLTTEGTLPGGLEEDQMYWITEAGEDTLSLGTRKEGPSVFLEDVGSTFDLARSVDPEGIYEAVRERGFEQVRAAEDIDDI